MCSINIRMFFNVWEFFNVVCIPYWVYIFIFIFLHFSKEIKTFPNYSSLLMVGIFRTVQTGHRWLHD